MVAIQLVICLGDSRILWEKGWFYYLGKKYPQQWELQREILFYRKVWCTMGKFVNDMLEKLFFLCPIS
jgi:hypothetical protein